MLTPNLLFRLSCTYMFRCGPYVSSMKRLDSSRFHWQRCRSSSHSALDRRPRRNNCSTYNTEGDKLRQFKQEGWQIFVIVHYMHVYFPETLAIICQFFWKKKRIAKKPIILWRVCSCVCVHQCVFMKLKPQEKLLLTLRPMLSHFFASGYLVTTSIQRHNQCNLAFMTLDYKNEKEIQTNKRTFK